MISDCFNYHLLTVKFLLNIIFLLYYDEWYPNFNKFIKFAENQIKHLKNFKNKIFSLI